MKALVALIRVGPELIGKQIHNLQTATHENYICICKDYFIMQIFVWEYETLINALKYEVWAGVKEEGENIGLIAA